MLTLTTDELNETATALIVAARKMIDDRGALADVEHQAGIFAFQFAVTPYSEESVGIVQATSVRLEEVYYELRDRDNRPLYERVEIRKMAVELKKMAA